VIYFDNAATTYPKPRSVVNAVANATAFSANPGRSGYAHSLNASRVIFECRQKAADFFKLKNVENCILTPSCTLSLNTVIYGTLKEGDHVVISSFEHNSVLRPVEKLCKDRKITYSVAQVNPYDDDETIDSFRKSINNKTKLIVCTHASNVFGFKLPVKRIAALAKYYGILFCLDAAQSAGSEDIDINDIGADFICVPGHKGLYGPMGTGLLLINTDKIPESLFQGGTGSSFKDELGEPRLLPDKFESGTINYPGFAGLLKGIEFVNSKTTKRIREHAVSIMQYIYDNLSSNKRVELYTKGINALRFVPLLSFNIKDTDPEKVCETLDKRFGICVRSGFHCSPLAHKCMQTGDRGTVRICPSAFSNFKDAKALCDAVFLISITKK